MSTLKLALALILSLGFAASAPAQDEDLNTRMMRATVKIVHEQSTATGFILTATGGKQVLVTAAHVLEKIPDSEATILFRKRSTEDDYQKQPAKIAIRAEGKPLWKRHATEDVAVMQITVPDNADNPQIPAALLATDDLLKQYKVHPGEDISGLGYPHRNEGNDAGFAILRRGTLATYPLIPTAKTKKFYFAANSYEGDSGGPVYLTRQDRSQPPQPDVELILGVIVSNLFLDEEAKMVYATTRFRQRLGLAIVVHASFVKELIEQLP